MWEEETCIRLMALWLNVQLVEAAAGRFNPHVHVEYEWNLRLEEIDESDDDLDDKVSVTCVSGIYKHFIFY